jgi:hypothetical protein
MRAKMSGKRDLMAKGFIFRQMVKAASSDAATTSLFLEIACCKPVVARVGESEKDANADFFEGKRLQTA